MATVPPLKQDVLESWSVNFSAKTTATPTAYGTTAAEALIFAGLKTDYSTRLATALDPSTRNKGTIAAKNSAKIALLAKARQMLKVISAYGPLTPQQRADLGMNPKDVSPTPVPAPATKPLVVVDPAGRLRLCDEANPTRRAKPVGVIGALVYMKITEPSAPAPTNLSEMQFAQLATRANVALELPVNSNNKTLYVFAQWVNDKGEEGPVSTVAVTAIAA